MMIEDSFLSSGYSLAWMIAIAFLLIKKMLAVSVKVCNSLNLSFLNIPSDTCFVTEI